MLKKAIICGLAIIFLAGCGGSGEPKKDPMRDWGTKKSTAVPMQDFPGGPVDNNQDTQKE